MLLEELVALSYFFFGEAATLVHFLADECFEVFAFVHHIDA